MKAHFVSLAMYNKWANGRLYDMASALPDEAYRRNVGAYFASLHGTLNHLLTSDRIWLRRLTGSGEHPSTLNAIVFDDLPSLRAARQLDDDRIVNMVRGFDEAAFEKAFEYSSLDGVPHRERLREVLAHLFNHQTHHRGQAHAILTALGVREPDSLDLLVMYRTDPLAS
jgi:uncharacterized damage-inducible protein DinB